MTALATSVEPARAATLKSRLRRLERRNLLRAFILAIPALAFLLLNFGWPIGTVLSRSVQDTELMSVLPHTAVLVRAWDAHALPDDAVARTLVTELEKARTDGTLSSVANRLNYDINGFRSLLLSTARRLPLTGAEPAMRELAQMDARWADKSYWAAIKHAAGPHTAFYMLAALDRRLNVDGGIVQTPPEQRVFVKVFLRTFWVALIVTLCCLMLGYPLAYLLASLPQRITSLLLILVLLPFWTSVLVRTAGWAVLLQREGILNSILLRIGVISEPLQLIYNRTGVYIAMTHVLLPFMVLPLYGVMKGIGPAGMRAALSLGAPPHVAFRRVYLPQTMPGISAGCLLVFILALGYYVTPALVGGADDQMVSYFIAFYTNETLNWGMAAALSVILLAITLTLYVFYHRLSKGVGPRWA